MPCKPVLQDYKTVCEMVGHIFTVLSSVVLRVTRMCLILYLLAMPVFMVHQINRIFVLCYAIIVDHVNASIRCDCEHPLLV